MRSRTPSRRTAGWRPRPAADVPPAPASAPSAVSLAALALPRPTSVAYRLVGMEGKTPGIDLTGLTAWLAGLFPDRPVEPPVVRVIAGGRSNLTYEIVHCGQPMVLRRPPLGHVLATAHDMHREYRVLTALAPTPVPVPVPQTLAYCADESVIGAPFYLMEKVAGVVYRDANALRGLPATAGTGLGTALADTLAALHTVDPQAVGLADFGRPDGFLDRQIRRWRKQLAASYIPPSPGSLPGWPRRGEIVARYAKGSGVAVGNLDWYVAFAYFKLAVILEGIYCRYTQGLTVGEGFGQIGGVVPELFARGHRTLG